ncbi:formimidoylglutamate deiminase [Xanthomonadaceae bacterium JHOS43]|nr:formimidoylglutamate deiminase [Xanthomonadaceae bacterium JHOS43]
MNTPLPFRFLTPSGWQTAHCGADADGAIASLEPVDASASWALPGIPNTHSHAFQRAMAGLAERMGDPADSFWTWRELMYRFAARLDPDSQYAIASQLYAEMLEAGYTAVCEFHYLHHQPDGTPYADPAAMSRALIAAAADTGIRMTLLPVLYMSAGFDGRALEPRQRRFGHALDDFLALVQSLRADENPRLRIGMALHSLRAVPETAMPALLDAIAAEDFPIHIHIAEQVAEVEQCLAVRGARPVRWLLDHAPVDARWTLVHATHLSDDEVTGIAASGASVSICPTTEANLGDGLFPLRDFLDAGGRFSIGSDSHVSVSPVEELRWLEYGQRLRAQRRNIVASLQQPSTAAVLLEHAWASGAQGCGMSLGRLEMAQAADWIVLDAEAPALAGARDGDVLDRFVFAGNRSMIERVFVGGERVVEGGRHCRHEAIAREYGKTLRHLLAD